MGVELPLRVVVTILECCVTFSGVKLSIRSFVLFTAVLENYEILDFNSNWSFVVFSAIPTRNSHLFFRFLCGILGFASFIPVILLMICLCSVLINSVAKKL